MTCCYPSFRYQIHSHKFDGIIYYSVWLGLVFLTAIVGGILNNFFAPKNVVYATLTSTGISAVTAVFVFVEGLCSFRENFGMALQNGVPRSSLFSGRVLANLAFCGALAVLDEALLGISSLLGKIPGVHIQAESLLCTLYGVKHGLPLQILYDILFSFCLLLCCVSLGYLITVLYYRLTSLGKVLVSIGVPAFFLVGIPLLKELAMRYFEPAAETIQEAVVSFLQFCFLNAGNSAVVYLLLAGLFSFLSWLMIRRAQLK